jgi:hypothetical protein
VSVYMGLNLLIGSSHAHNYFNVKLNNHILYLYIVQNKNEKQTKWEFF